MTVPRTIRVTQTSVRAPAIPAGRFVPSAFASRALLEAWVAAGGVPAEGRVYFGGPDAFVGAPEAAGLAGLPGLDVVGPARPGHFGSTDDAAFDALLQHPGLAYIPRKAHAFAGPKVNTRAALLPDPTMTWDELTDGGLLDWGGPNGAATNTGPINTRRANIFRLADRVFVGGAASQFAGDSLGNDGGTSWMSDPVAVPAYLAQNAQFLSIARGLPYAVVGAARTSDAINNGGIGIVFGGAIVNDRPGGSGWGGIVEIQHEDGAAWTAGWEIGAKSKAANPHNPQRPYSPVRGGPHGIWLAGGGGGPFGGAATQAANSALAVLRNPTAGLPADRGGWRVGLVITADGIDGTDGSAESLTTVDAVAMARRHAVGWFAPVGDTAAARIFSTVTDAALGVQVQLGDNAVTLASIAGLVAARATLSGTGADFVNFYNGSGRGRIQAVGASADVDLSLETKGTGLLRIGYATVAAAVPGNFTATRYLAVKDSTGTTYYIPARGAVW